MRDSTINLFYSIQTIIVFGVIWFKSEVWWYGLLAGFLVHPMLVAVVEVLFRPRGYPRYPRYFFFSAVFVVLYFFFL